MPAPNKQKKTRLSWGDILTDTTNYADDMVIEVKNAEGDAVPVSIGELRQHNEKTQGQFLADLERRTNELDQKQRTLTSGEERLTQILTNVATTMGVPVEDLIAGKIALGGKRTTEADLARVTGLDPDDPVLGPAAKELQRIEREHKDELKALTGRMEQIAKATGVGMSAYLDDYYDFQFEKHTSSLSPKVVERLGDKGKLTQDRVRKYAEENNLKDSRGRLNIGRAVKELTAEAAKEVEFADRLEKHDRERDAELRAATVRRPGMAGHNIAPPLTDDEGHTLSIGDAMARALEDPDILGTIATGTPIQ